MPLKEGIDSGKIVLFDAKTPFINAVKKLVDLDLIKNAGFKVVFDAMHGAGIGYLDNLLRELGVPVVSVRCDHNPSFGGVSPEPIGKNLQPLLDAVVAEKADIGIANDGDADRIGIVDEKGNFISTQCAISLLLMHLVEDMGKKGKVVKAASTSIMLNKLCDIYGLELIETPVGFKDVAVEMVKGGVLLGGEESGGYGIEGHIPERDGILIGLVFLRMMAMRKKPLSVILQDLFDKVGFHTYRRIDARTTQEIKERVLKQLETDPPKNFGGHEVESIDRIDGTKFYFKDGGWLLMRASGTEPLLRIYCEAGSEKSVDEILSAAEKLLK